MKNSKNYPTYRPTKNQPPVITRLQGVLKVELVGFEPTS